MDLYSVNSFLFNFVQVSSRSQRESYYFKGHKGNNNTFLFSYIPILYNVAKCVFKAFAHF